MSIALPQLIPTLGWVKWTFDRTWSLRTILVFGILLRIAVYVFLRPANNDPHGEFIEYLLQFGKLPLSNELLMAFHPPLYYLLAAPLALFGSAKVTQFLSLVLSTATLLVLYQLLKSTALLKDDRTRSYALMLAAILPQFVLFSLFVSNDCLAFFVGALLFTLAFRYVNVPNFANLVLLGIVLGMGLLTKGTFLAFVPSLLVLVFVVSFRLHRTWIKCLAAVVLFVITALGIGSYKFIQNTIHFGSPVPAAEAYDPEWSAVIKRQSKSFEGWASLVDFNAWKLMQYPLNAEPTRDSVPLMMYATFWYSYISESNFIATRDMAHSVVPRSIYLLGVLPSVLIMMGGLVCLRRVMPSLAVLKHSEDDFRTWASNFLILSVLVVHLLLVVTWGFTSGGAWSFFQSRLLFPAFFSIVALFGIGWESVDRWPPGIRPLMAANMLLAFVVFMIYYGLELAGCIYRYFTWVG